MTVSLADHLPNRGTCDPERGSEDMRCGSPGYVAPEVLKARARVAPSPRVALWALLTTRATTGETVGLLAQSGAEMSRADRRQGLPYGVKADIFGVGVATSVSQPVAASHRPTFY